MFQKRVDKLFNDMLNTFAIADNILIVGFGEWGKDHNEMPEKVLQICRQANLKLHEDKYLLRYMCFPFFGKIEPW